MARGVPVAGPAAAFRVVSEVAPAPDRDLGAAEESQARPADRGSASLTSNVHCALYWFEHRLSGDASVEVFSIRGPRQSRGFRERARRNIVTHGHPRYRSRCRVQRESIPEVKVDT